jgi:hypothetical protein
MRHQVAAVDMKVLNVNPAAIVSGGLRQSPVDEQNVVASPGQLLNDPPADRPGATDDHDPHAPMVDDRRSAPPDLFASSAALAGGEPCRCGGSVIAAAPR